MMQRVLLLLIGIGLMQACQRAEQPKPSPPTPTPVPADLTLQQTEQVLNRQAQQLLMLQAMQQQQVIFQQNMQAYRDANQRMQDMMHQQSLIQACNIAGNCEVRLVPHY
jgi:hypothetical protein